MQNSPCIKIEILGNLVKPGIYNGPLNLKQVSFPGASTVSGFGVFGSFMTLENML